MIAVDAGTSHTHQVDEAKDIGTGIWYGTCHLCGSDVELTPHQAAALNEPAHSRG